MIRCVGNERSCHVAPPSVVTAMAPQSPTAHTVFASTARTLKSDLPVSIGLFWRVLVLPPSAVVRISPDLPTAQPRCASAKSTLKSGTFVPLSRETHVLPPLFVR
jgi:hypothetical protein